MEIVKIFGVFLLIAFTAFFVAAEFSIVKVRKTRIDQLIEEGNKKAISAKKVIDNLDAYLSATQLGISVAALGLGWLGEPTVLALIDPILNKLHINESVSHLISFILAFSVMTFLNVVVGELAPKSIAIQKAESFTLSLAKPLILFYRVLFPFIWFLNGSSRLIIRLLGFKPASENEVALSEEELRLVLSESYKSGEINQAEMTYVNNIFEFDERVAKEIMVPRTEMVCFYKDRDVAENIAFMNDGQFTRYPVAEGDKDHIIGLVNIKELVTKHLKQVDTPIEPLIRPILHVSETTPIKQMLLKMQKERIHMAIVIDEYGGTSGLVTVEDILEEIVGEIRDEFDYNEQPDIDKLDEHTYIVDGKLLLEDVNRIIGVELLEDDEVDTIGGWIISKNLEAKKGTSVEQGGYQFIVEDIDGFQIKKVKIVLQ
ncbi:hemolysin family protein [Virgibacillus sp. 179-BFC.A HS]|uniref:Hemolysin family protein n=1 Tax=Tigheibacillus jepli TaxID=3035914 RepID=A0ABU5CFH2_9BACI|nr:hemolysin family protein [Virgibacillus sp. 179-BFC.A HS]MDY0404318.1 hemolysin family protein [Virgibacillus sp. 179-BFC.A HS]